MELSIAAKGRIRFAIENAVNVAIEEAEKHISEPDESIRLTFENWIDVISSHHRGTNFNSFLNHILEHLGIRQGDQLNQYLRNGQITEPQIIAASRTYNEN